MSEKKYVTLPKQAGIRKNLITGKYLASKKIKGKQFTATFNSVRDAQYWRATFNGEVEKVKEEAPKTTSTLAHVWQRMKDLHFPSLELSTQRIWDRRFSFWDELLDMHMEDITPAVVSKLIEEKKEVLHVRRVQSAR
ncbi:MAG: hypothetical protein J7501_17185 [Bdellovibrio sp.]|nr:hypothetical protein [Bdellovibrio sp.]